MQPVMLGVATMMHFQAWVREHAASNEIAAYNTQLLIVGMSATALQSEQEAAFNYGMHFFCPKPAKMEILGLMLDAKRACATNEAALDMICAATGTDYYTEPVQDFCHAEDLEEGDETLDEDGCFLDHHHPQYLKQQRQRVDSETDVNPATGFSHEASQHGDWVDLSALTAAATATESSVAPEGDSSIKASSKGSGKVPGEDIDAEVASAAAGALHTAQSSSSLVGSVTGSFTAVGSAASLAGSAAAAPAAINSSSSPSIAHPKAAVTDSHSAAEWSVFRSYRQSARSVAVVAPSASVAGAVEEAVRVAVASVAGKDEVSTNESAL